MTVGLVDFDSNVGRILVLLNTNGVCVTDSARESDTRKVRLSQSESVSVISLRCLLQNVTGQIKKSDTPFYKQIMMEIKIQFALGKTSFHFSFKSTA